MTIAASKAEDEKEYESAISSLRKRAAAGDARAKRMLRAEMDEEPEAASEPAEPAKEPADDEAAKAAAAAAKRAEFPPKEDEAKSALSRVAKLEAKIAADEKADEDRERASLLASRTDLDEPTRTAFALLPIAALRDVVKTAPKRKILGSAAASAVVGMTRAVGQGEEEHPSALTDHAKEIAQAMGVNVEHVSPSIEPRAFGVVTHYPAMTRSERDAYLSKRAAAKAASLAAQTKAA